MRGGIDAQFQPGFQRFEVLLEFDRALFCQRHLVLLLEHRIATLRKLGPHVGAQQFLARPLEHTLGLAVDESDYPVAVHRHDGVGDAVQGRPQPLGQLPDFGRVALELLQPGALLSDVMRDAQQGADAAVVRAQRNQLDVEPPDVAEQADQSQLRLAAVAGHCVCVQPPISIAVLRMDEVGRGLSDHCIQRTRLQRPQAGWVHLEQRARAGNRRYTLGLVVDDGAQSGFAVAQRTGFAARVDREGEVLGQRREQAELLLVEI